MKRLLALVVAVAMVVVALWLRDRLDEDEARRSTELRLVCATGLGDACQRLRDESDATLVVTEEPAGVTAARLSVGPVDGAGLDGWLVPAPWPAIVDGARARAQLEPLFGDAAEPVARSPLVLAVWRAREAALRPACAEVGWRCLGDAAAKGWDDFGHPEWGPVKPGHAPPDTDAIGLLVLGQAVAAFFDRTDLSTLDLDETPGFASWFVALERAVPSTAAGQLSRMLAAGPAAFDAVGTTEAEAAPLLGRAARGDEVALLYPSPMATADIVLAPRRAGEGATLLAEEVRRHGPAALAAAGWRAAGEVPAGADAGRSLPDGNGLPDAGLLSALVDRWREVAG